MTVIISDRYPSLEGAPNLHTQIDTLTSKLNTGTYPSPEDLKKIDEGISAIPREPVQTGDVNPTVLSRSEAARNAQKALINAIDDRLKQDYGNKTIDFIKANPQALQHLGLTVKGTTFLLQKIAQAGKDATDGQIDATDLQKRQLLGLRTTEDGEFKSNLVAMRSAIEAVKSSQDASVTDADKKYAQDLLDLLNTTAVAVEAVGAKTEQGLTAFQITNIQQKYAPAFSREAGGIGTAMQQVQRLLKYSDGQFPKDSAEEGALLNKAREAIKNPKSPLAKLYAEIKPLVEGDANKQNFINLKFNTDIAAGPENAAENASNDFQTFLQKLVDFDGDSKIEAVNSAGREWKGWRDALTLGIGYALRDKVGKQTHVHSELGLYDQIKSMDMSQFNAMLNGMGITENIVSAESIKEDKLGSTIDRVRNALTIRSNLLSSRDVDDSGINAIAQSKEVQGSASMQREIKKAVDQIKDLNGNELSPEAKNKLIGELTKRSLDFRAMVVGAHNLDLDELAKKFGEAIKGGRVDGMSIVALDLRVLKNFYESSRISIKGSAGVMAAASLDGVLPIASIGAEGKFTMIDSTNDGKAALDKL